jgi:uncharacterized protein YdeI (YjbR/CyaY-like superfamily)
MTTNVEIYLAMGCGRCARFNTPQCSVQTWQNAILSLRKILKKTELVETMKWGAPCYTYNGGNVVIIGAFRESCTLGFFKGLLVRDLHGMFEKPSDEGNASRVLRFTDATDVVRFEKEILDYLMEAIAVEASGAKIPVKPVASIGFPEELREAFEQDEAFRAAFFALTPGRQKSWLYHFNSAKQAATRRSRIEKAMPSIFEGKGMMER